MVVLLENVNARIVTVLLRAAGVMLLNRLLILPFHLVHGACLLIWSASLGRLPFCQPPIDLRRSDPARAVFLGARRASIRTRPS